MTTVAKKALRDYCINILSRRAAVSFEVKESKEVWFCHGNMNKSFPYLFKCFHPVWSRRTHLFVGIE